MNALLDTLRQFGALRTTEDGQGDEIATRTIPNREPEFAPPNAFSRLPNFVQVGLASVGITRLYAHQAQAFDLADKGLDLVLESPTASGKTLCFNVPLIRKLLSDPKAHAMMIHPMKALSNDQRRQFEQLSKQLCGPSTRRIESWLYDGDTEREHRDLLRAEPAAVLLTNPEMLHLTFLGCSEKWDRRFLKNLKVIVIDEMHEYRGFFGTNFSILFRRFLNKLHGLGVHPQLILATATCANAKEHAERLTGRSKFTLVKASNGMRPLRHFAFIKPGIPDFRFLELYRLRIARAALAVEAMGLSKSESRNPKSETNPKSEIGNGPNVRRACVRFCAFCHLDLFRISCFGFRISATGVIRDLLLLIYASSSLMTCPPVWLSCLNRPSWK